MVSTDEQTNQKVTLDSETIKLLNECGEPGQPYDQIIQKALKATSKKEAKAETKESKAETKAETKEDKAEDKKYYNKK